MKVINKSKKAPKLRFQGFMDAWNLVGLNNICEINPKNTELPGEFIYIDLESISQGTLIQTNTIQKESAPSRAQRLLHKGDVLFQTVRPYQKNHYIYKEELLMPTVASTGFAQLRSQKSSDYIYHLLYTPRFASEVSIRCTGSNYPAINSRELSEIEVYVPSLKEQQKIADFYSLLDRRIEKQKAKVEALQEQKKGWLQKIFSQELRFKDENGKNFPEWKKSPLKNLVDRITRKNQNLESTLPLTISAQHGLVDQISFFNKTVASANLAGYYLLYKGEFAYNKSYSNGYPLGAIKRLEKYEKGVLSSLYICFKAKEKVYGDFLNHYFESTAWHKEVSMISVEGARNHGLLNVSVNDFFDTIHYLPSFKEQQKIAFFLNTIGNKLEKEKEKLEVLQQQKKGFMQQMFV